MSVENIPQLEALLDKIKSRKRPAPEPLEAVLGRVGHAASASPARAIPSAAAPMVTPAVPDIAARVKAEREVAEARARAERETREREAAEARAKAEREAAEARAKAEREAQEREAQEARARSEREAAEARAKADREVAEARAKAEREAQEARARAEREAAEREAQEARARSEREAEARAKAEREAQEREAQEARARAEREAHEREAHEREAHEREAHERELEAARVLEREAEAVLKPVTVAGYHDAAEPLSASVKARSMPPTAPIARILGDSAPEQPLFGLLVERTLALRPRD